MARDGIGSVLLVVVGAVVLIFGFLMFANANPSSVPGVTPKSLVHCTAEVENPLLFPTKFVTHSCKIVRPCLFSFQSVLFTIPILQDENSLSISMKDGARATTGFVITEFERKVVDVEVCSNEKTGELQILDKNSNIIERRNVVV